MEKKINLVELLKDCPSGMELNCTMFENVKLLSVYNNNGIIFPITVLREDGNSLTLTKYGQYIDINSAKCVIFPKGKTTWEGFHRPFKDGDIVYTRSDEDEHINYIFIFESITENTHVNSYLHIKDGYDLRISKVWLTNCDDKYLRFATEEEKQRLFDVIKANGYHWNAETKTLEKLVVPKFKVGDRIRLKNSPNNIISTVTKINGDGSLNVNDYSWVIEYKLQDKYELVPNKFDITTLKPFDRVLVRHNKSNQWRCAFFSHIDKDLHSHCYKFVTTSGKTYPYCIPYEDNQELLGTTNKPKEYGSK